MKGWLAAFILITALSTSVAAQEFRGLGYEAPDFKLSPLHTSALSFTYEPAFAVAYRF